MMANNSEQHAGLDCAQMERSGCIVARAYLIIQLFSFDGLSVG